MESELARKINELVLEHYPHGGAPGCAVLVRLDGETIFARGYGVSRIDGGNPITPETNFRLASMSKQFTAAAVLRLVDQQRLRLDESLVDVFRDFPEYGRRITIRHLLGHTSGLPDYEDLMPADSTDQILDAGVLDIMCRQTGTVFPPGKKYAYSNTGYAVLAMIVETRSGRRYADYLREEFFLPLGMVDTLAREEGHSPVVRRAYGHKQNEDGSWRVADQSSTSAVLGDGGVYTSVLDYAKWADAWFAGRILSSASRETAWTRGMLNDGTQTGYGCGWRLDDEDGSLIVHHTGSTTGFNTNGLLVPARKLCIVMLSNRVGDEPKNLVPEIKRLVLAENAGVE